MLRILVIVSALVVLGVYAPQFAPGLLSDIAEGPERPQAEPVAAAAPVQEEEDLSPRKVALLADERGHFSTAVIVNGREINVMIDTGATMVALTEATARRLGISPARRAFTEPLSTGNGVIKAAPVTLAEVRLGGIRLNGVRALVVPGKALPVNLLGMSFLSRLSSFQVSRDRLILVD
jgi:aspartyl protease family protein